MANTLSLLALKTAPDVFDLSSGLIHVSIRDQIVRARLLVRDLDAMMPTRKSILIVGGGVAGVAAACAAATRGFKVLLLETRDQLVALQGGSATRFIGPHMYEWPADFSANQEYPGTNARLWPDAAEDCPRWGAPEPITGKAFAMQIRSWLTGWLQGTHVPPYRAPVFLTQVKAEEIRAYVADCFVPAAIAAKGEAAGANAEFEGVEWQSGTSSVQAFTPDFVVLAAGMGREETVLPGPAKIAGPSFWSDVSLGTGNDDLAVFGDGDGALQDVLRAITNFDHPLQFIAHLRRTAGLKKALRTAESNLSTVESQNRLSSTWTVGSGVYEYVDEKCRQAASEFLPKAMYAIRRALRRGKGTVWLISRSDHITKAYVLNRFVFHLLDQYYAHNEANLQGIRPFKWVRPTEVLSARKIAGFTQVRLLGDVSILVDYVAVRWGIQKTQTGGAPGLQLVGITDRKKARRTTLAQVPLPYVVR